jgi:hypothetical protein
VVGAEGLPQKLAEGHYIVCFRGVGFEAGSSWVQGVEVKVGGTVVMTRLKLLFTRMMFGLAS